MQVNTIKLENGQNILVEVVDVVIPKEIQEKKKSSSSNNIPLPRGANHISMDSEKVKASISLLKDSLKSIANTVEEAFKENKPDEFSLEMNFGFAGKGAVPFIASAESNAGIKVKATWKKGSSS